MVPLDKALYPTGLLKDKDSSPKVRGSIKILKFQGREWGIGHNKLEEKMEKMEKLSVKCQLLLDLLKSDTGLSSMAFR